VERILGDGTLARGDFLTGVADMAARVVEPDAVGDCLRVVKVASDEEAGVSRLPRRSGDVDELYAQAWPGLVRLGHLLTGSAAAGEDLAQEAFLGLLRQQHPVANARAYLRRSIVNLSVNAGRRDARERAHLLTLERPSDITETRVDELWPLLQRLPAKQRAVLVLRYYEDLTEREIARVLGCRPGTVKSLASRALEALRRDITDE
jgi:RNA polymerase sigma factor (sigma-70 family)